MEDIFEIYEPIYRENSSINWGVIFILIGIILGLILLYLFRKKLRRVKEITLKDLYNNSIENITIMHKDLSIYSSSIFSKKISLIYKDFLSKTLNSNLHSLTVTELFSQTKNLNSELYKLFFNFIEPAIYGKKEILKKERLEILKLCVEDITNRFKDLEDKSV